MANNIYTISCIVAILLSIVYFFRVGDSESITLMVVGFCMLPVSIAIDKHDAKEVQHE